MIPDATVEVREIRITVVVNLEIVSGILVKQNPSAASEDLDVAFVIGRKS